MNKLLTMLFVAILTAAIMGTIDVGYSSTTKPSVPEFSVEYVDYSYDIPHTYGIDPYTGDKVIVEWGDHVDKRTIEVTIKNQPFSSYEDAEGNLITVYYNFRYKGTYGEDWTYYPFDPSYHTSTLYGGLGGSGFPTFPATNSDYTVAKIEVIQLKDLRDVPIGSKVEFQVQALLGYIDNEFTGLLAGCPYYFVGEKSDWSNTQTFTINENQQQTPNENQTTTPSNTTTLGIPEQQDTEPETENPYLFTFIAAGALIAIPIAAGLGLLIYLSKRNQSN